MVTPLRRYLSLALFGLLAAACSGGSSGDGSGQDGGDGGAHVDDGAGDGDAVTAPDSDLDVVPDGALDGALDAAVDGAVDSAADGEVDAGCECPFQMHCDEDGLCQPDVCLKGTFTCADLQTAKVCAEDGSGFELVPCMTGQVCFGGVCWDPICEPGEIGDCDGGALLTCNSIGTDWVPYPCPAGQACDEGECRPVPPNVVLLIDTSGSMNWMLDGSSPDSCFGGGCPPWSYPNCDNGAEPLTRLGKVKAALEDVIASPDALKIRFGLQRFAQVPFPSDGIFGWLNPITCGGGLWDMPDFNISLISGDDDSHITTTTGWFGQNVDQIMAFPLTESGETDLAALGAWFDTIETSTATGGGCLSSAECPGGPCVDGTCHTVTNPELRAVGGTPLGKSLFYAGEYLRHYVLVEGKFCEADEDCGSAHHTCVEGSCHDPHGYCRPNIIIVFSDGAETENVHIDDFFHPRVQAKRMHYGLGCQSGADCVGGSTCLAGVCRPPAGEVDEAAMVCETGGMSCTTSLECPDPCITWSNCQGYCTPTSVDYVEGMGADRLVDLAGKPISATIHVVDASGVAGQNEIIAAYGGGTHISVDLAQPGALLSTVTEILGDTKNSSLCGP